MRRKVIALLPELERDDLMHVWLGSSPEISQVWIAIVRRRYRAATAAAVTAVQTPSACMDLLGAPRHMPNVTG